MSTMDDLLRRSLASMADTVAPPDIDAVRDAIARAERRRRAQAGAVIALILVVTVLLLVALGFLRQM